MTNKKIMIIIIIVDNIMLEMVLLKMNEFNSDLPIFWILKLTMKWSVRCGYYQCYY